MPTLARAAPPGLPAGGHPGLRRPHRRRPGQQHPRDRAARVVRAHRTTTPTRCAAWPCSTRRRSSSPTGPTGRGRRCVEAINNPEDESAGTREVPVQRRALDRAGRLHARSAEEVLPAHARTRGPAAGRLLHHLHTTSRPTPTARSSRSCCTYDPETAGGQAPDGRKVKATIHWVSADHAVDATVHALRPAVHRRAPRGRRRATRWRRSTRTHARSCTGASSNRRWPTRRSARSCSSSGSATSPHDLDDPPVFHRTVGLRDEWANIQKRQNR